MALSRLDAEIAIVLVREAIALAHSTDPEVWEAWRTRADTFIERIRANVVVPGPSGPAVILRADAIEDQDPEDWHD